MDLQHKPTALEPGMMDQRHLRGYAMLLMIFSSIVISFGGLIMRNIEFANPPQIAIYRSIAFIAAIFLIMQVRYRGDTVNRFRAIGIPGLFAGLLLGIAGVTIIQALKYTTVANTMFTLCTIPFMTAALAWIFLKERLSPASMIAMTAATAGVSLMVLDGVGNGSLYGNIMAVATAAGFAGFAVIVRAWRHTDMLPSLIIAGFVVIAISVIQSQGDFSITPKDMLLCFLWGGVLSGLGHWAVIISARYLVAGELTLFMLVEFAIGPIWVWLFVGETPTSWALTGGLVVLASVGVRTMLELGEAQNNTK